MTCVMYWVVWDRIILYLGTAGICFYVHAYAPHTTLYRYAAYGLLFTIALTAAWLD